MTCSTAQRSYQLGSLFPILVVLVWAWPSPVAGQHDDTPGGSAGPAAERAACSVGAHGWWGQAAAVQVAVLADSISPDLDELTDQEVLAALELQRKIWSSAPVLREVLEEDLRDYKRIKRREVGGDSTVALFEVDENHLLEKDLARGEEELSRTERDRLLHARLGLSALRPEEGATEFPAWICERLVEHGAQLGVLAYLQSKGIVLKLVLAHPCMKLGSRAKVIEAPQGEAPPAEEFASALHDALVELLHQRYWASVQVEGPKGMVLLIDGETAGRLPLDGPVCTTPGARKLSVRGEQGCDTKGAIEPGDSFWSVEPRSCELESHEPRIYTWVTAGLAVALAGAAVASHLWAADLRSQAELVDEDRKRALALRSDAQNVAMCANLLYGAAGAAALSSVLLFFLEGSDSPEVACWPAYDGSTMVGLAGHF